LGEPDERKTLVFRGTEKPKLPGFLIEEALGGMSKHSVIDGRPAVSFGSREDVVLIWISEHKHWYAISSEWHLEDSFHGSDQKIFGPYGTTRT
jgi:hypothetical protein